jgi:hypothetical protein
LDGIRPIEILARIGIGLASKTLDRIGYDQEGLKKD